jgi:effector-binding domain-containing protein
LDERRLQESFVGFHCWLNQIEQENIMSKYDVVIKKFESVKVASIRAVVPTPPDQRSLWDELMRSLDKQKARMIGIPMAIYHNPEFKERDWDIEVVMPVSGEVASEGRLKVYTMPAVENLACVVHTGSFATIGEAYDALAKWIEVNGFQIVGPGRELNLRLPEPVGNQNDPDTVNEIQFPVQKVVREDKK